MLRLDLKNKIIKLYYLVILIARKKSLKEMRSEMLLENHLMDSDSVYGASVNYC